MSLKLAELSKIFSVEINIRLAIRKNILSIVKNNCSNDSCLAYESLDEGEQRLLKYLKNFSVNSRPVNISSKAVHVNVTMQIVRLDAVVRKLYRNVKGSSIVSIFGNIKDA